MTVRDLDPAAAVPGLAAGDTVVCVPLFGGHDVFARCLERLGAHTPPDVPLLIADDATPEPRSRELADRLAAAGRLPQPLFWSRAASNLGFVENVNRAFAQTAPANVALVNSDVEVAEGWFDGLRDAALSAPDVATATALTNHGTIVSVPERNTPRSALPDGLGLDDAAARVRAASSRARPEIPTAIGHCFYVRRDALDRVGAFDPAFSPGYGEEVDFSQRCLAAGLRHVVADDVFVLHHGSASFGDRADRVELQAAHERLIADRYPGYHAAVEAVAGDTGGLLARALDRAAVALTISPRDARRRWWRRRR
jgi:GT2 family glycosyltransferase